MSDSWSHIYEELPTDQIVVVNEICDRFERAWRQGENPAIGDFFTTAPDAIHKVLLHELALIDATYRRQAGQEFDPQSTYQQYPEVDQAWLAENLSTSDSDKSKEHAHPAPPKSSRYEIMAEIGRGGMGVVYQARDPRLGRIVCLKSLHPETSRNPQRLSRFLREARVISSLNHPNICTIHELEEGNEQPYLVLEWIEGTTFRELTRQGPDPNRLIDLLSQVARALEAAHAAGVVHRDVKPENLMVRGDGLVKVLDFGLARLVESEQPALSYADERTAEGAVVGTAKYMSPEQARGQPVTAASDIFSLGIVFYELATGRHPFPGSYLAAILSTIVEIDPPPLLAVSPNLDPRLAALGDRMLEKRPENRPPASEVIEILDELRSSAEASEIRHSDRSAGSSQVLVGRESELVELRRACTAAETGRGSAIFVSGEPGIGKTTLLEAFVGDVARRKGFTALRGRCSQRLSSADAYLPVLDALGRCLEGPEGQFLREFLQATAPAWEALSASSTDALARISAESGQLSQGRLKREFRALLDSLAQKRPVLLFLDDLHWSDESTVDLLGYIGQDLLETPMLILGSYRPTDSALQNLPFEQLRRDWIARNRGRDVELSFLSREQIGEFLQRQFPAHHFPESLAELLHQRSEGSPLFVSGLVRLMQERGVIARSDDRWVLAEEPLKLGHELPDSIANLIDTTLTQLTTEDRQLLQAASVQGVEFDAAVVADALEIDRADVEERLQEIERVLGVIRTVGEVEFKEGTLTLRHAFVHVLFQEALYSAITPARRAAWSLGIARVLTKLHGKRSPGIVLELAFLYESGRDFSQAIECLLESARHEVMIGANREAAEACRRGLQLLDRLPPSAERDQTELQLQFTRGFAETYAGSYGAGESLMAYQRALELCARQPASKEHFSVLHGLWANHSGRMDAENRAALEEQILQVADQLGLPAYQYAAHTTVVLTLLHQGNLELAERHLQLASTGHDYTVDDDRRFIEQMCMPFGPVFHTARSWLRQLQGREEEALVETAAAVAWEEELDVPQFQVSSWYATLYYLQHNAAQSLLWARKSIEYARRAEFEHFLDRAMVIEAWAAVMGQDGEREQQESLVDAALQRMSEPNDEDPSNGSPLQMCILGEALAKLGRYEQAEVALRDSLEFGRNQDERWWEAETLRQIGWLHERAFGDRVVAQERIREGLKLAKQQGAKLLELRCEVDLASLQEKVSPS